MQINFSLTLTKSQERARQLLNRKSIKLLTLCFSRQSGKTTFALVMAIEYMLKAKYSLAYICPQFGLARKFYRELVNALTPTGLIKKSTGTPLYMQLVNGSEIQFFSAEKNPQAIRGQTFSGLVIVDECSLIPDRTPSGDDFFYGILGPTMKVRKPKLLLIGTPLGKSGYFYEMFTKGSTTSCAAQESLRVTINDDQLVTKEEIEEIRMQTPELAFRQEFLCEFLDSSLTAFPGFEQCFKSGYKYPSESERVWIGIDLSTVGTDETIVTAVSSSDRVRQWRIDGSLDQKYRKIAEIINSHRQMQACYIETNSIGEPMMNEIAKLCSQKSRVRGWNTTNSSKNEIVSLLQTKITNGEIEFSDADRDLKFQMGVFTYTITKAKNITYAAKPPHHDDRVMSLAIALRCKEDNKSGKGSVIVPPLSQIKKWQ